MIPDQVASDLDIYGFQNRIYPEQAWQGLNGPAWLTAGHKCCLEAGNY